jgi:hypothetical protein
MPVSAGSSRCRYLGRREEDLVAGSPTTVPARRTRTPRAKRVLLTGPDSRLVLAQHERQDRQLLALLSRRSA